MKIGIIQASSQASKNALLYENTKQFATCYEVIDLGCFVDETVCYSYIEISVLIGLLLNSGAVDFIVTGCSSGQGMMLACNTMPGVICGYAPTPKDAYLFAQINNGNAISLPLGEEYTYTGADNCRDTLKALFSEPFGQGYPKNEAARKLLDTERLKDMKSKTHVDYICFLNELDDELISKIFAKRNVIDYILSYGIHKDVLKWIDQHYRSEGVEIK